MKGDIVVCERGGSDGDYLLVIRTDFDRHYSSSSSSVRDRGLPRRFLCVNLSRGLIVERESTLWDAKYCTAINKLYGRDPAKIPYDLARLPIDRLTLVEVPFNILSEVLRIKVHASYLLDLSKPTI